MVGLEGHENMRSGQKITLGPGYGSASPCGEYGLDSTGTWGAVRGERLDVVQSHRTLE